MEQLIETFFQIDKEFNGRIETRDLENFVQENNLEDSMIQTWFKLFDPENTGSISLNRFCDRLGLAFDSVETQRKQRRYSKMIGPFNKLGPNVDVKFAHMREDVQLDLVNKARELLQPGATPGKLATELKLYLDRKYGSTWHTGVVLGSYWMSHSHVPEYSLHFRIDNFNVIAWRTLPHTFVNHDRSRN